MLQYFAPRNTAAQREINVRYTNLKCLAFVYRGGSILFIFYFLKMYLVEFAPSVQFSRLAEPKSCVCVLLSIYLVVKDKQKVS